MSLGVFLASTFPGLAQAELDPACWVSKVIHIDPEEMAGLSEAVGAVRACGQERTLQVRLRRQHPLRPHNEQYDERVLDVLTEACAFAWAAHKTGQEPQFCQDKGRPDILVPPSLWIEAKAIHESRASVARWRTTVITGRPAVGMVAPPAEGFYRKFDFHLSKARAQLLRVGGGVIFVNLTSMDMDQLVMRREVLEERSAWCDEIEQEHSELRVVLTYGYEWRNPVRDVSSRQLPDGASW